MELCKYSHHVDNAFQEITMMNYVADFEDKIFQRI